jgi:4a-hydroxytetrahydrobiopterin dehydratase
MRMTPLPPEEAAARARALPGWTLRGGALRRTFAFPSFRDAIAFVQRVAELAEAADHHPDIDIRYDRVTLTLTTHEAGGLTAADFDLAARIGA